MRMLTSEEVLALHTKLTACSGGSDGLRDRGLLESAVYSAQSSFGGQEVYPTVEEKAARLMYALVSNHAFLDGNKRIGLLCCLVLLRINGVQLRYTQEELIHFGLSVADGTRDYAGIRQWIAAHTYGGDGV